jgi:hypothetical protein
MTSPEQNIVIAKSLGYNLIQDPKTPFKFLLSLNMGFWYNIDVRENPDNWNAAKDEIEYDPADKIVPVYGRETAKQFKYAFLEATKDTKSSNNQAAPVESKQEPKDLTSKHEGKAKQKKKKTVTAKNNDSGIPANVLGLELPIVYPTELTGKLMRFKQWRAVNNVIPAKSEVVILGEDDKNYNVYIPQAHISFPIGKGKAEVIYRSKQV